MTTQPLSHPILGTLHETLYGEEPRWHVVLWNDPVSLYAYVVLTLTRMFGYTQEEAAALAQEAELNGKAAVWTGNLERAQYYVQQLHLRQLHATLVQAD